MRSVLPNRALFVAVASCLIATLLSASTRSTPATVTGWFACDRCAPARLKLQKITATNRECSQRCIAEGARTVFIDERSRTIRQVANPELAKGQESHYVRVTGRLEEDGRVLRVESVKVLETYVVSCRRSAR